VNGNNNNNRFSLTGWVFVATLVTMAFLSGMRSEIAFATGYGSSEKDITGSEIIPATKSSESSSDGNNVETIVNQQNECEGNIVICQNILTKYICTEKAVCIIGNLDPFLLVLPK
jgi:hypothetical protein